MDWKLSRSGNRIQVHGHLGGQRFRFVLAALHDCVRKRGYQDVVLDFSECMTAFPVAMLPICANAIALRTEGIDLQISLPADDKARRLFINSNWAGLICPEHPIDTFRGYLQVPAIQFRDINQQKAIVDRVMNSILKSTPDFEREDFAAVEWALSEITDNVINHSHSEIGGLIQLNTRNLSKRIDFVVCDLGLGIPATLMPAYPEIESDMAALEWAIREGVTRDPETCQGNGLFGSSEVSRRSGGFFSLYSGNATLFSNDPKALQVKREAVPVHGTLVDVCISFAVPNILADALRFRELAAKPTDYIFVKYQSDTEDGHLRVDIKREATGFGSRAAGKPIRQQLLNLMRMSEGDAIEVDFGDLPVISSSFADEAIGKMAVEAGLSEFRRRFRFSGVTPTVRSILARAISQRAKQAVEI